MFLTFNQKVIWGKNRKMPKQFKTLKLKFIIWLKEKNLSPNLRKLTYISTKRKKLVKTNKKTK